MAKQIKKSSASAEREMRDRMNGILRDENGKMTHIHGKLIAQIAADAKINDND